MALLEVLPHETIALDHHQADVAGLKILLLNPKTVNKYYHVNLGRWEKVFGWFFRRFYDRKFEIPSHVHCTTMPPVTLYALESLFGCRCQIDIVDEQVDEIDRGKSYDLVCMTATTTQVPRAIELSHQFRARGIRTAIGGVHATCLPQELAPHFDTICIGEAEGYLDRLLLDLAQANLQAQYHNDRKIDMADVPFYRYDIGGGKYLPFHVLNYSRGCTFKCDFCSIQATLGGFRTRPVEHVVEEIRAVGHRNIWFPDATLTANPERARALFRALIPLNIRWLGQITLNVAKDMEMLDLMAESGCWLTGIGFDSLSKLNLKTSHKVQNRAEDYERVIAALHRRNIAIEGNFMFGFDEDDDTVFETTAKFVNDQGIDLPELYVLTPYPDTELYRRMLAEGRIVDHDWSHYDNTHFHYLPVFEPKLMSREALREGCRHAEKLIYNGRSTIRRLWNARSRHPTIWIANYIYMQRMKQQGNLIPQGEEYVLAT
jgi:radical SAM superfamily enzyme YgiQ (UPF0313 family)